MAFLHNVPRAMFVFLPLVAGVMMLLYWRPRHYYVEHLLLLVHNHACVFLTTMLAWVLAKLVHPLAGVIQFVVFVYLAWYIFRSMRVVYRQGRWLTGAKFVVLAVLVHAVRRHHACPDQCLQRPHALKESSPCVTSSSPSCCWPPRWRSPRTARPPRRGRRSTSSAPRTAPRSTVR